MLDPPANRRRTWLAFRKLPKWVIAVTALILLPLIIYATLVAILVISGDADSPF